MADDLVFPTPDDFAIEETELAPGKLLGSFQTYLAEAFCSATTVRTFKIPFYEHSDTSSRQRIGVPGTLAGQILGYTTYDTESDPPGGFQRILPWVDFHLRHHVAARVDISTMAYRGLDDGTDTATLPPMQSGNVYKFLIAQVHFAAPKFRLGNRVTPTSQYGELNPATETSRFFCAEIKNGIQYSTVAPGPYQWAGTHTGQQILFDVPAAIPFQDIIVTWLGLPASAVPLTALSNCLGRCNREPVLVPNFPRIVLGDTYDSEQLVLHTYNQIPDYFPNGDEMCHLQMVFKARIANNGKLTFPDRIEYGWNHFLYPGTAGTFTTPGYERVKRVGGPDYPDPNYAGLFETANFDDLFLPEPAP